MNAALSNVTCTNEGCGHTVAVAPTSEGENSQDWEGDCANCGTHYKFSLRGGPVPEAKAEPKAEPEPEPPATRSKS